jgi:hypothetical protein
MPLMQRWILFSFVVITLLIVGGGFAYKNYKQNRAHPVWVPLRINPELPLEKQNEIAKALKSGLSNPEVLLKVSMDLNVPKALGLKSDEQAADVIASRLFVNVGKASSPNGIEVPAINVGVKGIEKDQEISGKIAVRLIQDVWKILGIDPPAQNGN